MIRRASTIIVATAISTFLCATAQADISIYFFERNGDVIIHTTGVANSAPVTSGSSRLSPERSVVLTPASGEIFVDAASYHFYYTWTLDSQNSWGNGRDVSGGSFTGDPFFLGMYSFGISTNATTTQEGSIAIENIVRFNNATLADLGLTPGTYTRTITGLDGSDTITTYIGVIPEPSSYALIVGTVALLGVWAIRRRKRA